MRKKTVLQSMLVVMILGFASLASASEGGSGIASDTAILFFICSAVAAGVAIAIAAAATGIGQGMAVKSAMEGIARNPEASGKIQVNMIIGLAMIESLCIYALVVALILIYANPAIKNMTTLLGL